MLEVEGCGDCKFFEQHYGINKDLQIFKLCCGHCLKNHKSLKKCNRYEKGNNYYFRDNVVRFSSFTNKIYNQLTLYLKKFEELEYKIFNEENKKEW